MAREGFYTNPQGEIVLRSDLGHETETCEPVSIVIFLAFIIECHFLAVHCQVNEPYNWHRWAAPEVGITEGTMRIRHPREDIWGFGLFLYELTTQGTSISQSHQRCEFNFEPSLL
jgi:hypothetical protein